MHVKSALAAFVAVLALAGCSSDAQTPNPGASSTAPGGDSDVGPIDVCGLVTVEEASAAFGAPVGEGQLTVQEKGAVCVFPASVGSVDILYFENQASEWETIKTTNASVYAEGFEELSGIGDAAYTTGLHVYVLVAPHFLRFGVVGAFEDTGARALALAQAADL